MRVPMRGEPRSKGFTLIELLIVIGLIGFLAAAVLLAVDPVKRIQESRDSRRSSETNALLNAILTKQVDDSGLYSGCCDTGGAPIITQGGPMVQVIVTSDAGIVCNSQAARPGCDKLMDTTGANKNCVAMFLATFAGTGTATSTGSSAFVTGTGTSFTTQTAAGNTVRSASGGTCTVLSVNSNTQISCSNTPSPVFAGSMENHIAGTGTATSSNTTAFVNGTGTAFTTQVQVGDMLTSSSNGVCSVQIINSNSQITCGNTPSPAFSGSLSWTRIASGQASSSGAIVTGSGSSYTTQIQAGDVLSNGSDTCTVQSVDSDTQITCTASPSPTSFGPNDLLSYTRTLSGSATSTGTTPMVFGTGTSFTTEQATATRIRSVSGSNCIIASRVSNTQITCSL